MLICAGHIMVAMSWQNCVHESVNMDIRPVFCCSFCMSIKKSVYWLVLSLSCMGEQGETSSYMGIMFVTTVSWWENMWITGVKKWYTYQHNLPSFPGPLAQEWRYVAWKIIMKTLCSVSLVPRLPHSRMWTLKLFRHGEPGIFCDLKSINCRVGVERP